MGTFYGLEMARKALFSQQSAIYTTGHNIANANTPGYSRQRVNFSTTTPFPVPSRVQPQIAGQMGTGVEVGSVQRIRDQFLDSQFRTENSKLGFWDAKSAALKRMENLLNEPTEQGLSEVMNAFWQSLNDLAVNPDNTGARSVVAHRGEAVAETFNYLAKNLKSIQADLKSQIDVMAAGKDSQINSLLRQINDINVQVQKIEPHGFVANDLYDKRDVLIDELSQLVNIKVERHESAPSALDIADGVVSIELLKEDGSSYEPDKIYLIENPDTVSDQKNAVNEIDIKFNDNDGKVAEVFIGKDSNGDPKLIELDEILQSTGELIGLIKSNGYDGDEGKEFNYPHMMAELDKLAHAFAEAFNAVHAAGVGIDDNKTSGIPFFTITDDAETLTVNPDILKKPNLIAAGDPIGGTQNGENAIKLAEVFDKVFDDPNNELNGTSVRKFFTSLIGEVGVTTREANRMKENTGILQHDINNERMAVSAVSLDEEFTNLIKFQHAYNAAARNITAVDEMIDRIINNMGIVGR